jgi:hypothetical protein
MPVRVFLLYLPGPASGEGDPTGAAGRNAFSSPISAKSHFTHRALVYSPGRPPGVAVRVEHAFSEQQRGPPPRHRGL